MRIITKENNMNQDQNTNQQPVSAPAQSVPGNGLSIAGFAVALVSLVLNFFTFGIPAIVGLVLSIIGRVQTKRAGKPSGLALAGIIISAVAAVITLIFYIIIAYAAVSLVAQCQELGPGVHSVNGTTITCDINSVPVAE